MIQVAHCFVLEAESKLVLSHSEPAYAATAQDLLEMSVLKLHKSVTSSAQTLDSKLYKFLIKNIFIQMQRFFSIN
jgi:hypothetical protein